jgi:hypothetical protein
MSTKLTYVTLHGIPLSFKLNFPFHQSAGGADYHVLHGNVALEDGSGLYAEVAVHMSRVIREVMPSGEEKDALGATVNAIRKAADTRDIEFLKSNKRQPIQLSSRCYSQLTRQFTFSSATEEQMLALLKRKMYWAQKLESASAWVGDPVEALYLNTDVETLQRLARRIQGEGLCMLEEDRATATKTLMAESEEIEGDMKRAIDEINAKHAYERVIG